MKPIDKAFSLLYPFQQDGVQFLYDKRYALLADDPGLGKTAQLIVAAWCTGAKKVLILCPEEFST